jgi:Protein of unknown function (DUF2510)
VGGVSRGWYPDYDAPTGHERYWNGERWTERRAPAPPPGATTGRFSAWIAGGVCAVVACLVIVSASVLVLGDDQTASSGQGSPPPPARTPAPPAAQGSVKAREAVQKRRAWDVAAALDGVTLRLTNGAIVRLAGVSDEDNCAATALAQLVEGQRVTLTRRGPDKDAQGLLLRYVEREGVDVGLRLIQRGLAAASDLANPRRSIYQKVDAREPDACA